TAPVAWPETWLSGSAASSAISTTETYSTIVTASRTISACSGDRVLSSVDRGAAVAVIGLHPRPARSPLLPSFCDGARRPGGVRAASRVPHRAPRRRDRCARLGGVLHRPGQCQATHVGARPPLGGPCLLRRGARLRGASDPPVRPAHAARDRRDGVG